MANIVEVILLKRALAQYNIDRKTCYNYLKPKQIDTLFSAAKCIDTLSILPTGYGKTLIFELLPYFLHNKFGHSYCILISSPLNAIIKQQLTRSSGRSIEITSDFFETKGHDVQGMIDGKYMYILGHPEHILTKQAFTSFQRNNWAKNNVKIAAIVVDECHCVVQWGEEFRTAFKQLFQLRSIFPSVPTLALTATASLKMQGDIKRNLHMRNTHVISACPDRPNIYLAVQKRLSSSGQVSVEDSFDDIVMPLLEELREKGDLFPKTIVFTKLKWCGYGHNLALRPVDDRTCIAKRVAQYHAPCTTQTKEDVVTDLTSQSGCIRLVFATEAFSMGADVADIRRIIHIGPPGTIETFVQEVGRAGRDGAPATASLYYNNADVGGNIPGLCDDMREYCKISSCRRQFVASHLGHNLPSNMTKHECCDNCRNTCECDLCIVNVTTVEENEKLPAMETLSADILQLLMQYFDFEVSSQNTCECLSEESAVVIAKDFKMYSDPQKVLSTFPYLSSNIANNIAMIVSEFID